MLLVALAACEMVDPTVAPPAIASFSASPNAIETAAQPVTLSWNVSGATSVVIEPGRIDVSDISRTTVYPIGSTSYTLVATNGAGQSTREVVVTVGGEPVEELPTISAFSATPSVIEEPGQPVTLSWSVSGATSLLIEPGGIDVTGLDEWTVAPDATTTYRLIARNAVGERTRETVVSLEEDVGEVPVIASFTAWPDSVEAGEAVTLSWSVSDAQALVIDPGAIDVTGLDETTVFPSSTTTYVLTASNAAGSSTRSALVTVEGSTGRPAFGVLVAGQSNAVGTTETLSGAPTALEGVRMLGNDYEWKPAYEPLDDCTGQLDTVSRDCGAGVSFGVSLGNEVARATEGEVLLIPAAKGGSDATEWFPASNRFDRTTLFGSANNRARLAGTEQGSPLGQTFEGTPYGVVAWFQGESETSTLTRTNAYYSRTNTVFNAFEEEIGAPIILAQLGRRGPTAEHPDDPTGTERNLLYQRVRETQRLMAAGARTIGGGDSSLDAPRRHLVVTHDLPVWDGRHLSVEAQLELGRRYALAIREHLFGEAGVDGTGPRLVRVEKPSETVVRVVTDRPISQPASSGAEAYAGYFTVFAGGSEVPVASIVRDPGDTSSVLITLAQAVTGGVEVRYMPPPGNLASIESDVIRSATCAEPMPGGGCLPMAAFGMATATAESTALQSFFQFDDDDFDFAPPGGR